MNFLSWHKTPVKNKVSIFIVSTLLIGYLLYIFLLVPKWAQLDELTSQYQAKEQQLKIVQAFAMAHPNPEFFLLQLDNKIFTANQMLPDTADVSSFILQLEQLATDCGVQLNSIKPGKIDNKQGYREIAMEISVKGNFPDMMNFLHKTESGGRFISIATIGMQIGTDGLESKMLAKIYSYGVPAAPVPPAAPPAKPPEIKK